MKEATKIVLRPQHDDRLKDFRKWKIVKKTYKGSGGWARYGSNDYYTREDAQEAIRRLVSDFPNLYKQDI